MDMMSLRRRIMGAEKTLLPREYQQVEYLESTGTQLLATDLVPTMAETDEFYMRLAYTLIGKIQIFYGTNNAYFTTKAPHRSVQGVLHTSVNNSIRHDLVDGSYEWFATPVINEWFEYHCIGKQISCLGVTREISENTVNNQQAMFLFAQGTNETSTYSRMRLSSVYYKRNGEYLLNLIPCYRKSDQKTGMYDLVSGEFYTNAGTGEFIVGSNV